MDNNESPEVIIDALEPSEKEVLRGLAKKNGSEAIRLRPLERFGFSGAKLYEAFFDRDRKGLPFVVKVHEKKKIKKEIKAYRRVQHFFVDCLQGLPPAYTSTRGAVAYKEITCGKGKTLELRDLVVDSSIPGSRIASHLRQLYRNTCSKAHEAGVLDTIVFRQEYKEYFREPHARRRIKRAIGEQSDESICTVLATEIPNPLYVLKKGFKRRLCCQVGPVHGDLHSSNVMLDQNKEPHLIDFTWANRKGHLLKDYVLMENSLRFMLFPEDISPDDQLKVDQVLLSEKGYEEFKEIDFSSPSARKLFFRLSQSVRAIRIAATKYTNGGFNEYLAAQFLVLYGLLSYDNYNFFSALRALGLIAGKLLDSEYMPKPRSGY